MRASRLLNILMTLQARGHATAPALAEDCGVSLRTVYRDIDALSALGIPVYAERGPSGGYRLLDGYRTRLNGLSPQEAEALFLTGLSGPAGDLGLGPAVAAAELKLLAALPASLRPGAQRMRARFHLDTPAWFAEAERPDHLPRVADAVWSQQRLWMRYQSWKGQNERRVEPLGIVLKSGVWYLVGRRDGVIRTYRVARIDQLRVLQEHFERPESFDLAAYWQDSTERLEAELHPVQALVRLSPTGVRLLSVLATPYVRAGTVVDPAPGADGWYRATVPVGSMREACADLLRLGADAEVLAPVELRRQIARIAAELAGLYNGGE